ncbi:MAG TPA: hypothetical protein VH637_13790 [Streptosporangiaceae bacterium]
MSETTLRYRIRPEGTWQRLLPGVYLAHTGPPTSEQRELAALLFAGRGSVLTGPSALAHHGIRAAAANLVDVLVPAARQRQDAGFVRVRRTTRMPDVEYLFGQVRCASPARAVADTARLLTGLADVRAVAAGAVQCGKVQLWQLADEVRCGPAQGAAQLRQVLGEVADGVRSAAEGDLRTLIRRARLPAPMYNARLFVSGIFVGSPDAWWPDACVAAEVESREWHFAPRDWEQTLARDARMSAHGIIVLHFPPRRLRAEQQAVAGEIRSALESGKRRGHLGIDAVAAR